MYSDRLLFAAALLLCTACNGTRGPPSALPEPPASSGGADSEAVADRERRFQLARTWAEGERTLEAQDLVGDLLLEDSAGFRARIEADPAFSGAGFARLLLTGGVSPLAEDEVPHTTFDVDGDAVAETFAVSYRTTRTERFLAIIAETRRGAVAQRLGEVTLPTVRVSAFRTGAEGALVLLEGGGGHSAALEIRIIRGVPPEAVLSYSQRFILDPGESDEAPPADGELCVAVIDVALGGEAELVLTLVDPTGEPKRTWVLQIDGSSVRDLGAAEQLRRDAAGRLRAANPSLTRPFAEALTRLEPASVTARLALLRAVDVPTQSEWWGFYPPGTNNFVALHGTYYARHTSVSAHAALAAVPQVASFLGRWSLTPEQLATHSDSLVPPTNLWGRAYFLEEVDVSTAFSYFRLVEVATGSLGD